MPENAPQAMGEGHQAPERSEVYLSALSINEAARGTVCVIERHYLKNGLGGEPRHIEPYRMGYHHGSVELGTDHWHAAADEAEYHRCKKRMLSK